MPRNNDVYSPPPGTGGTPQTPISSAMFNAYVADITTDLNAARPVVAGGTGATTAKGALENIGAGVPSLTAATTPLDGTELVHVVQGGNSRKVAVSELAYDPWTFQPIGVPIPVLDSITGVAAPPTDQGYRYVLLSAGEDGTGEYNEGILASESVSGSAPLVVATAVIDLAASPLDGQTINLINTERRFLRAGSAGTLQDDAMQGHWHEFRDTIIDAPTTLTFWGSSSGTSGVTGVISGTERMVVGNPKTDSSNGTPRTENETRSKNIGVTYYMRIL